MQVTDQRRSTLHQLVEAQAAAVLVHCSSLLLPLLPRPEDLIVSEQVWVGLHAASTMLASDSLLLQDRLRQ